MNNMEHTDTTTIMAISINPRNISAPKVQEVLTKHGCIIETRLGLHNHTLNECSNRGIILLTLYGEEKEINALNEDLKAIDGVKINTMTI